MKKAGLKQFFRIFAIVLLMTAVTHAEVSFPLKVGTKPESITKGFDGKYYVTLMNEKEEGDGQVAEISEAGVRVFATGLDEPKGIVCIGEWLYLSDLTRVWRIDRTGKAEVFVEKSGFPEEVRYLNDVSANADSTGIYVVDMGATGSMRDENGALWPLESEQAKQVPQLGRIYHVDLEGNVSIAQDTHPLMLNPNGVGIDNDGNVMVGEFFLGHFLVHKNGTLTPLKGQFRGADAVEQDNAGNYYISSWTQGTVWKIDAKTEAATVLVDGLKSAADFYLEADQGRLLLPDMLTGTIYAIDLTP